jgi:tryptophan synthase beta chain
VPAPIHAGGLRYHGMAPTVSQLINEGLLTPRSVGQMAAYEAGVLWARTEGFIPAPETNNALALVVEEAQKAKAEGQARTIVFNFSGHGLLDLGAYEKFFSGELFDHNLDDAEIEKSTQVFKDYPKPQHIKSR